MLAPPWKPSSLSSPIQRCGEEGADERPRARGRGRKLSGRSVTKSTRFRTSADGPVKLSAWIGCGSKADGRHRIGEPPGRQQWPGPTPMAPAQPQGGTLLAARPERRPRRARRGRTARAPPWPMPVRAMRSRAPPPSMVHHAEIARRSGDRAPVSAACAVTAKTRPDSSERRLPCAASTSRRLEQPRARIMPMPNKAAADRRARQTATGGDLARIAGIEPPDPGQGLGHTDRGGKGKQPDRELAAGLPARELDHRRAQAEARALRHEAEGTMPITSAPSASEPLSPNRSTSGRSSMHSTRLHPSIPQRLRFAAAGSFSSWFDVGMRPGPAAWRCGPRPRA